MSEKRVLMLPVGVGLAHTGRLVMVARELQRNGVKVVFGAGSDAVALLRREGLHYEPVAEFSHEVFNQKIKRNNWFVYTSQIIRDFVRSELALIAQVKPSVVVFDTRPTARVSSQIAGVACVAITNVDATPFYDYSKTKFPVQTLIGKFLPKRLAHILDKSYSQAFLKRLGPHLFQGVLTMEMIHFSPTLMKLGYKLGKNPFQLLMGDLTLIADIPQFRPVKPLPRSVKMIGPIFWDGKGEVPEKAWKFLKSRDVIYVTASGTGDKATFLKILTFLAGSPYTVVATTGNTLELHDVPISYPNIFVTDFLPGDSVLPKAQVIIFPGGNATCYQALWFGVPAICTPLHIDQEDNSNQMERLGAGLVINPHKNLTKYTLLTTIERVTRDVRFRRSAQKIRKILRGYDGKKRAAEEIMKLL